MSKVHFSVSMHDTTDITIYVSLCFKACSPSLFQILQSIANHVLFTKEEHMRPFNDFVKSNFDAASR